MITVQELGLQAIEDARHLERATQDGRVVVTQDADFYGCTHPASRIEALHTYINKHRCPTCYDPSCYFTMHCPPTTWSTTSNFSDPPSRLERMLLRCSGE